ncbi:EF-hand domain-containing protein [Pseudorhodobacter aquimaris]|uniref:EF-hand domain-containing protein n=1 Tax=Pseudorhodobacter aquimaris TaxID=687412 RepID=UPI00067BC630|nr:EF-hand domain-containing protein [Pseudorhodobacter aquimaris]
MKRSTKFAFAAVATLGLGAVAVPVIAQQTQMQHGGMMRGHDNMMGRAMGMMMGGAGSYAMATFDTDSDGTLSPEEMTAGIQAELSTYDTDANGTLSLDEFAVMHVAHTRPMAVRAFQMHDADGDAQVTDAEMAAMAAMMQDHSGERQGDMPGAGRGMMGNN